MIPLFLYSGFILNFSAGIYPISIANTQVEIEHDIVSIASIIIGIGQVIGGGIFILFSSCIHKVSRLIILIL